MNDVAVSVEHLAKRFRMYHEQNNTLKSAVMRGKKSVHEDFWALKDVSFEVPRGSTFGLIGRNGSGKSTLLKCLAKILYPDQGRIQVHGRQASLLEVGSGFHPELSGRENVFLNGSILGMTKKEVTRKFDEIVSFAGVGDFIDQPVKNYSSGMYVRLGFSVAVAGTPDVLVVDEVLAVGDATFQKRCRTKFREMREEGRTVILVSHSMSTVRDMCDQVAWLDAGQLRGAGDATPVIEAYNATV
ncbi:MAG: transporter ATP-binding protein [Microbacterium sp.]|nr:transporter ATP-binding protein [Microbacterium sp.]